jgi:predicted phage tail protein
MIRTIHLHGALGQEFQRQLRLDVDSPAEAVRALCTMVAGFKDYLTGHQFQVFRGALDRGIDLTPQELHARFADDETDLHIVPFVDGHKRDGIGKVLVGGLLVAASFVVPGGWAIAGKAASGIVAQAGVAMVIGGVSQILARQTGSDYDNREQPKSQLFNAVNQTTTGVAVPVIVGECEVGSVVVSGAIHVEDRVTNA